MFAENSHLELLSQGREVNTNAWRSHLVLALPVALYDSKHQEDFLKFATASPETGVREAEVRFAAEPGYLFADFIVDGHDVAGAIDTTVATALGGLVCTEVDVSNGIRLVDMHLAWLRELAIDPSHHIDDPEFDVTPVASQTLHDTVEFFTEAA